MWTITKGVPTMSLPLVFILGVAAIKEILEDMEKHKADNIQNGREVDVFDTSTKQWIRTKWSKLRCGQLVRIKNREFIPADIVLVGSSDQVNNGVFINTKSLDGETDLKIREVPDALIKTYEDDATYAASIAGEITCELPTKILTKFEGAYSATPGAAKTPITLSNVILRGCQVKQTKFAIGVRFYWFHFCCFFVSSWSFVHCFFFLTCCLSSDSCLVFSFQIRFTGYSVHGTRNSYSNEFWYCKKKSLYFGKMGRWST